MATLIRHTDAGACESIEAPRPKRNRKSWPSTQKFIENDNRNGWEMTQQLETWFKIVIVFCFTWRTDTLSGLPGWIHAFRSVRRPHEPFKWTCGSLSMASWATEPNAVDVFGIVDNIGVAPEWSALHFSRPGQGGRALPRPRTM